MSEKSGGASWVKWVFLAAILAGLFVAMKFLPVGEWLEGLNGWIESLGWIGPVVYLFAYAALAVLFVPGSALTIGAGAVFGLWVGVAVVSAGSTLAAALAFLIARYIARDAVERKAADNRKFAAIDKAIGREGAKLIGLLRLSPAIPYSLSNYLYGLTAVKFWRYVLASWLGMLPGTFLYVYLGVVGKATVAAAEGAGHGRTAWEWSFLAVGLVMTIVVTVWVTKIARRELEKTDVE